MCIAALHGPHNPLRGLPLRRKRPAAGKISRPVAEKPGAAKVLAAGAAAWCWRCVCCACW